MANILRESARGTECLRIEDVLFESREIFFTEEVTAATSTTLLKHLMYLEKSSDKEEVTLYINSPGGDVVSGLAVYDYIRLMKSPVRTVCTGTASSMGAILFLAGDKREMLPHARIMIHDPSYRSLDMGGRKPHEIQCELDYLNKTRKILAEIIAERTEKSLNDIYKLTEKDTFFDAQEAVDFGIANKIMKGASIYE